MTYILCLLLLYLVTFNSNIITHTSERFIICSSFIKEKKRQKRMFSNLQIIHLFFCTFFGILNYCWKIMKCYSLVQDILCQCSIIDTAAWNIFHAFCWPHICLREMTGYAHDLCSSLSSALNSNFYVGMTQLLQKF